MTSGERAGFIVAGLVETLLFVVSSLGFVGAIVRKQLFVQLYAYFLYVHFLLNIGVAGYLLYLVTHFSANATTEACQDTIQNKQAQSQCTGFLKVAEEVYLVVAATVLLVELYVALVVTRYLNQLQNEKRSARGLRLENEEAFGLVLKAKVRYSALPDERDQSQTPVYSSYGPDFDPYEEIHTPIRKERRLSEDSEIQHDEEEVSGDGFRTHSRISLEEQGQTDPAGDRAADDSENTHNKLPTGLSFPALRLPVDSEFPKYTLSDHTPGLTTPGL
ncbi:hypothetical protein H2248_004820 [Termitomyces sp. 'cryptogamus']|nr:hypothetical protein H2248_004820 [Termitomyces sp. 'cryptogamus']